MKNYGMSITMMRRSAKNYVLLISPDCKLVDMLCSCEEDELSKYDFLRSDLK